MTNVSLTKPHSCAGGEGAFALHLGRVDGFVSGKLAEVRLDLPIQPHGPVLHRKAEQPIGEIHGPFRGPNHDRARGEHTGDEQVAGDVRGGGDTPNEPGLRNDRLRKVSREITAGGVCVATFFLLTYGSASFLVHNLS